LSNKLKAAKIGKKTTRVAFEELDAIISLASRTEWEADEKMARNYRGDYLKIYEVKMDKGVSALKLEGLHTF
jgi:hypothetical protein